MSLASSNLIPDKRRKIELINDAYTAAGKSREPVKRRSSNRMVDTRAGFKHLAFELGLDQLSMQSAAAVKMLSLDRSRARTMFDEITLPTLSPLTCDDALTYDLDPYYQAGLSVFEHGFTVEEKAAGSDVQFLLDQMEKVKSLAQLVPALKMLLNANLAGDHLAMAANALTKSIDHLSSDPRSFAFAMERELFLTNLKTLLTRMKTGALPSKDLANAIRRFLVKNFSGDICSDSNWISKAELVLPAQVQDLNSEFSLPITADELRPSAIGPKASDLSYWTTPRGRDILMKAKGLRFGGEGEHEFSEAERQTEEWRQMFHDFLGLLANWDAATEQSEDDYFQEKCNMYHVLVDLCPDDIERDLVLRNYGEYLKDTSQKYKGSIAWIFQVKDYLRVLRFKSDKVRQSALDLWVSSSDTNLRIYGELSLLMSAKS